MQLLIEAAKRNTPVLTDDDHVSIGYGSHSVAFPIDELPSPSSIDWDFVRDIPLALITGTNGKSTTVRLAASIINAAKKNAGMTTTDYIRVGDDIVDKGDYSGPGGARTITSCIS